ncbi:lung seven transmembrane receptor-domain-containing protein, partial [Vararia minispora EC-137]
ALLSALLPSFAFEVPVVDTDYTRQICSGMWANQNTFVNVSFDDGSQGQLAIVIYEWNDYQYLGKITSETEDYLPQRTYVCTSDAVRGGFCSQGDVGRFILDLPDSMSISDTSFWSARVAFATTNIAATTSESLNENSAPSDASNSSFWNNPDGNPTPPASKYDTPWRRQDKQPLNPSPSGLLEYHEPIQYLVRKTGYYCVAIVPVTVLPATVSPRQDQPDAHPHYSGSVLFQNKFNGKLPATDYPKVNVRLLSSIMRLFTDLTTVLYGYAIRVHDYGRNLGMGYYLSGLVGFLVVEMLANLTYYRYLNAHKKGTASTVFLFVVAILDAGRNSLSFFLLLVVSLGLSVVREDLGKTMRRCQILAGFHFIFGVLYAVGIVELEFESTSALVLLMFVIPLAFTLSGFLMWTLYSLNATIVHLRSRKQHFKLRMFQRLQWILIFVVIVITIFFFVSSLTFSGRLAEDYAAKSWQMRWWLLDGWLSLLYFTAFAAIAYLWRPSPHNSRLLMSEELAQDEEDAEDYDLEALESRTHARSRVREDDEATLVGGTAHAANAVADDAVVFEIGDEDAHDLSDDDDDPQKHQRRHQSGGGE